MRRSLLTILLTLVSAGLWAAESKKPDYSKDALLLVFREEPEEQPALSVEPYEVRYTRGSWIFRFLPIMMPILVNDGSYGQSPGSIVDPFHLTGITFPYTKGNVPVEDLAAKWTREEKRYRRRMLAFVRVSNARENRD